MQVGTISKVMIFRHGHPPQSVFLEVWGVDRAEFAPEEVQIASQFRSGLVYETVTEGHETSFILFLGDDGETKTGCEYNRAGVFQGNLFAWLEEG